MRKNDTLSWAALKSTMENILCSLSIFLCKFCVQNARDLNYTFVLGFDFKGKKQLNVYNFSKEVAKRRLKRSYTADIVCIAEYSIFTFGKYEVIYLLQLKKFPFKESLEFSWATLNYQSSKTVSMEIFMSQHSLPLCFPIL